MLPVVDSRLKRGLPINEITPSSCILVMEVEDGGNQVFVGALVDAVAEVLEIDQAEIKESQGIGTRIKRDYITDVYHDRDKFILILDMNRIYATYEVRDAKKITDKILV